MITVENQLFSLHTRHTSYLFRVMETGHLEHLYYGRKIHPAIDGLMEQHAFAPGNTNIYDSEHLQFSLEDTCLEMSSFGKGDIREPFVELTLSDGSETSDFLFEKFEQGTGKEEFETLPGSYDESGEVEWLGVTLRDKNSGVILELHYYVYQDCDVITRSAKLINESGDVVKLNRLMSLQLDLEPSDYVFTTFHGAWAREMGRTDVRLVPGKYVNASYTGTSSSRDNPFVMLGKEHTTEDAGECFGFNLIYSGNHYEAAEVGSFGKVRIVSGINPQSFCFTLESGESFEAPEAVMTYASDGYNAMSQNMHRFVREHIVRGTWKKKERPVLLNSWEAAYFDINERKLLSLAKAGKEAGIELFVMDDGWFGKRDDDNSSLGDWFVNEKKLGGTLSELIDRVHAQGVKFGIWIEPEMVNEDSNLYREHPDWAIQIPGKLPVRSRNQLLLDFSRKEVRDNIFDQICAVFDQGKIDYVKWDMNRSMADVYAGNLAYDYVLGVYDFMERLVTRYPDILLEGCSGGGGRFDAGMLYYSPQIWCSDNTDAINRTRIQYGTSFFYPVSSMGAHVSAVPNHQTGRVTSLKTRGITAMAGTFGYELNPALLSDEEKEEIREQIKTFKKYEMLINEGTYWRLTSPFEDEVAAWMSVSRAKDRALVSVVRLYAEANAAACYVKLKGLESDAVYIEENTGRQYTGAALMNAGIPLPFAVKEYEAYQFSFIRLDEAKKLYDEIKKVCGNLKLSEADTADSSSDKRIVISIYGGSGSGKTTIAAALQQYFLKDNTACYVLTGDNYPHRIPMRNDEERLNVYNESGEDGLRGYLGTPKEIDFDRINKELSEFKEGKDIIEIKHMGRQDGDISYDETDFTGIKVLILEWTHGGSEYLKGVDIPVFLESSPEETKARRIKRGRDENAASPFICRVVELEQEKLDLQSKNARIVVGKDGKVYEQ